MDWLLVGRLVTARELLGPGVILDGVSRNTGRVEEPWVLCMDVGGSQDLIGIGCELWLPESVLDEVLGLGRTRRGTGGGDLSEGGM